MASSTVPANSGSPSVHNSSSPCLYWNEVIQPNCKSLIPVCRYSSLENEKTLIKCGKKIKRNGVSSPNNCSTTQKKKKKKEEDEFESPTEKKTAEEDEKQIANLVDEKPAARTRNLRPRRKTNSKYASSASEDEPEFISSLTIKEIEEDYFYLFGKPPPRIRRRVR